MKSSIIPTLQFGNNELPLKVQTIRSFVVGQDVMISSAHRQNYYEMIWVTRGKGTIDIDLRQYVIADNMIICIKPDQAHWFKFSPNTQGFVLSFPESFFRISEQEFDWVSRESIWQVFSRYPIIKVYELMRDMKEIILKMIKEYENFYPFRIQLLKRYFRILLIYIVRQLPEDFCPVMQSKEKQLLKNFMALIDKRFKEKKLVAEYALQLRITPNYLNKIVKKNTGYPASHHIRQRVVLEAKRLGHYSDATMKTIAIQLGFLDIAHFSKFFKSVSGTRFSDFKKKGISDAADELSDRA